MRVPPRPWLRLDPGCVVSYCPIASSVGARVLHEGGNAIDAAVATAFALAVTYPQAGNLGGGGFMLLQHAGEVQFLDYRETAPRNLTPNLLLDAEGRLSNKSVLGGLCAGTPGTIAGLAAALERFGTWPWEKLLSLVIPLAEKGVWITTRQAACLELYREGLTKFESTRQLYLPDGDGPAPGTLFEQRDLAWTLRELATHGPRTFYEGKIAEKIVTEIARNEGVLDGEDLAAYRPVWRAPLRRKFLGRDVYTPSLPSAGALVVNLSLGLLEALFAAKTARGSVERYEMLARVFRVAFAYEHKMSGDPDYLDPGRILEAYADSESEMVATDLQRLEGRLPAAETLRGLPSKVRQCTTHFCVIDKWGNAVSNTYTLNTMFGSKLAVGGAGFLLNNCIDDFRIAADVPNWYDLLQGDRNQLRPNHRPVSSMTPTMIVNGGKVELVIGGSGGPRIPTAIVQTVLGVFGDGASLGDAMRAPRVHHQLFPDEVVAEMNVPDSTMEGLAAKGHAVSRVTQLGICAAIRRNLENDDLAAILDPRFGDFW